MTQTRESRPGGSNTGAAENTQIRSQDTGAPSRPHLSDDDIAAARPAFALLVKTPSERITRRLFLSLHAATKAAERAENRGGAATVVLVRLAPHAGTCDVWGGDAR